MFGILDKAYSILGVTKQDTMKEIKNKYRRLIAEFHPDSYKGNDINTALEITKELNWAYEVISREDAAEEDICVYTCKAYTWTSENDESNLFENREAFCNRSKSYEGEGFYCWDPQYEDFRSFALSIDSASRKLMRKVVSEIWDNVEVPYQIRIIDLISSPFFEKIYYLLQQEYLRPFYCLCKLIELNPIDKEDNSSEEYVVHILLRKPGTGKRTENIERLHNNEEVQLCCILDHPIYPNTIEIFNMNNESLGELPPEYSVCLSPLIQMGVVEVSAKVCNVLTRAMRGKKAGTAQLTIELMIKVKKELSNEKPINVNNEIKKWIDKYREYVNYANIIDKDNADEFILDNYSREEQVGQFDKLVFHMRGTFGQRPNDGFCGGGTITINDLEDTPKEHLGVLLKTANALNNRKRVCEMIDSGMNSLTYNKDNYLYFITLSRKKYRTGIVCENVSFMVYKSILLLE